jgi:hypothetical protein
VAKSVANPSSDKYSRLGVSGVESSSRVVRIDAPKRTGYAAVGERFTR